MSITTKEWCKYLPFEWWLRYSQADDETRRKAEAEFIEIKRVHNEGVTE